MSALWLGVQLLAEVGWIMAGVVVLTTSYIWVRPWIVWLARRRNRDLNRRLQRFGIKCYRRYRAAENSLAWEKQFSEQRDQRHRDELDNEAGRRAERFRSDQVQAALTLTRMALLHPGDKKLLLHYIDELVVLPNQGSGFVYGTEVPVVPKSMTLGGAGTRDEPPEEPDRS